MLAISGLHELPAETQSNNLTSLSFMGPVVVTADDQTVKTHRPVASLIRMLRCDITKAGFMLLQAARRWHLLVFLLYLSVT